MLFRSPVQVATLATLAIAGAHVYAQSSLRSQSIHFARNFYGVYRVTEGPTLLLDGVNHPLSFGVARVLYSGQIYHGLQFMAHDASRIATTYYSDSGGLGFIFREMSVQTNRHIGIIGLGVGTIGAYGAPGDRFRFYEINSEVERVGRSLFSYITNSQAEISIVIGDGRMSLQREASQQFDLLILDAFSGDSIPTHLLTLEAMDTYIRHLKPDGIVAFHISNSHLDLEPVVRAMAEKHGLTSVLLPAAQTDISQGKLPSVWMLLTADEMMLNRPLVTQLRQAYELETASTIPWTDEHSSLYLIFR